MLSNQQKEVLELSENLVITGAAGTGKTLLLIHKAALHASRGERVLVLTYTKSLKSFIKNALGNLGISTVHITHNLTPADSIGKFDLVLIDEAQDFSMKVINDYRVLSNNYCVVFGDTDQQLYGKTYNGEKTASIEEVISHTGYRKIELTENFRNTTEISKFINLLVSTTPGPNGKKIKHTIARNKLGILPEILKFDSTEQEIGHILQVIKQSEGSIGIFLKKNDGYKGGFAYNKDIQILNIPGVKELYEILIKNQINVGFKYHSDDQLDFEKKVNIMTYHSAKGLEFDTVILPFNTILDTNDKLSILYVGATRVKKKLVITYTHLLNQAFAPVKFTGSFQGKLELRKPQEVCMPLANGDLLVTPPNKLSIEVMAKINNVNFYDLMREKGFVISDYKEKIKGLDVFIH